ncbi:frataxin, mitochondrial-like [Actinia tenebrosa]|uniref:ferroxidase n=1 Tax=Actinia tenebrosa TaxID=6105 RepID=A0A6P8HSF9_ACTTE|nr:frataxin, mitochondrial-like [Actinia tenebrosa]
MMMLRSTKNWYIKNNAGLRAIYTAMCRKSYLNNNIKKISIKYSQQNVKNIASFQSIVSFTRSLTGFQNVLSFHNVTDETLEGLSDFFDDLSDHYILPSLDDYDVQFGDGVLTVKFGGEVGTYVINKQTPNQQIWLSSPKSGPKRYDFVGNKWVYKRDQVSLHELLSREMSNITGQDVDLTHLPYGGMTSTKD